MARRSSLSVAGERAGGVGRGGGYPKEAQIMASPALVTAHRFAEGGLDGEPHGTHGTSDTSVSSSGEAGGGRSRHAAGAGSLRPRSRRRFARGMRPMGGGAGREQWGLGVGVPEAQTLAPVGMGFAVEDGWGGQRQGGVGSRFPEAQTLAPVGMGFEVDDGGRGRGEEQWGLGAGFPRPRPWHRLAWGLRSRTDGGGQRQGGWTQIPRNPGTSIGRCMASVRWRTRRDRTARGLGTVVATARSSRITSAWACWGTRCCQRQLALDQGHGSGGG